VAPGDDGCDRRTVGGRGQRHADFPERPEYAKGQKELRFFHPGRSVQLIESIVGEHQ
jgi:hypothetical protein